MTTETTPREGALKVFSSSEASFLEKYEAAQIYLDALAKPVGSLGTLEEWAARLAAIQGSLTPNASQVCCLIFAADHGAAAAPEDGGEACSAYPQFVTRSVLEGLRQGVAGASVLAKTHGVPLRVVDVGVIGQPFDSEVVQSAAEKLPNGTRNFCSEPAMTIEETDRCIRMGRKSLAKFAESTASRVVALGEVGIGNTTASSAIIAALTDKPVNTLCGGGAFAGRTVDYSSVEKKIGIVTRALEKHEGCTEDASNVLSRLGGAELAALVGAMLEASEQNLGVLVDGFIATAAALVAVNISSSVCRVLFFSTKSAEQGHIAAVERIQEIAKASNLPIPGSPALSMGLRMGEATGALLAVPVLKSAAAILSEMATIQEILSSA